MISAEKQFEHVTDRINACAQGALDGFKLFLQLFSAIVGGSVWLDTAKTISVDARNQYGNLSILLSGLVTAICVVIVFENLRGWYGYRKAQARLDVDNPNPYRIPPPRLFPAPLVEGAMTIAMLTAFAVFWIYNPFLLPK